jgi:hypothetical protein
MTSPSADFVEILMSEGNDALDSGNFDYAISLYTNAAARAETPAEEAGALQMKSIAHSLNGEDQRAGEEFASAMRLVRNDPAHTARIMRDSNMALLRIAMRMKPRSKKRAEILQRVEAGFSYSYGVLDGLIGQNVEAMASLGFLGRVALIKGDRFRARQLMQQAHAGLRGKDGNPVYARNNLMWLIRVVPPSEREELRRQIMQLIEHPETDRQVSELKLIMLGGDRLYMFVYRRTWVQCIIHKLRRK